MKDVRMKDAIGQRGGGQAQVNQLRTDYHNQKAGELANLAAEGDVDAETAIKILKQARKKRERMVEDKFPIGCSLKRVLIVENQEFGGDELCLEQLLLFFEAKGLNKTVIKLEALADTDEIEIIPLSEHEFLYWHFWLEETPLRYNQPLGSATTEKLTTSLSKAYTPIWCSSFIGKKLQTVWICKNAQGYFDKIDFAFERLHPSISLIAEGSVLKVFRYEQIDKLKASPTELTI